MISTYRAAPNPAQMGEQVANEAMLRAFLEALTGFMPHEKQAAEIVDMLRGKAEAEVRSFNGTNPEDDPEARRAGLRVIEAVFAPTEARLSGQGVEAGMGGGAH